LSLKNRWEQLGNNLVWIFGFSASRTAVDSVRIRDTRIEITREAWHHRSLNDQASARRMKAAFAFFARGRRPFD
jgi:hypothetical protein